MDVFTESLSKFRELMKQKGPEKVVEEFSVFKDDSGVFMPDVIPSVNPSSYIFESFVVLNSKSIKLETTGFSSSLKVHNVADKAGAKSASWDENDLFENYDWAA